MADDCFDQLENEWELSKENVLPLRQGRTFNNLNAALQQPSESQLRKIKEEKHQFELDLRTYKGDDPLGVWSNYVTWTEQNFPKGGKESHTQDLLERCISTFRDDERYRNDTRFLSIWVKFAGLCNDPVEIFTFLFTQNMFTKLSAFYVAWASELETMGNMKKANTVYSQGLECNAEPTDLLQIRMKEFQMRSARQLGEQLNAGGIEPSMQERAALGELKGRGNKSRVPVNRASSGHAGRQSVQSNTMNNGQQKSLQGGQGFQVFSDENSTTGSSLPPPTGEWSKVPKPQEVNRENEQKPGQWSKAKVKQKSTPVVKLEELSAVCKPAFAVHEDQDTPQPFVTPRKQAEFNQVLSAKKPSKNDDPFKQFQALKVSDTDRPMYCKHLIYAGMAEFSFEEIRAARYFERVKKQEILKREEELQHLEQVKRLEIQKQEEELRRQREELLQESARLQMQKQKMEDDFKQKLEQEKLSLQNGRKIISQQQELAQNSQTPDSKALEKSILSSGSAMEQKAACLSGSTLDVSRPTPSNSTNTSQLVPNFNFTLNTTASSGSRINPSPDSSVLGCSHRSSNKSTPRSGIAAPSPTVNTKEAFNAVLGMFNQTFNMGWNQQENKKDDAFEAQFHLSEADHQEKGPSVPAPSESKPFTIYEEPENKPFTIYEEPENKPFTIYEEPDPVSAGEAVVNAVQQGDKDNQLTRLKTGKGLKPLQPVHVDDSNNEAMDTHKSKNGKALKPLKGISVGPSSAPERVPSVDDSVIAHPMSHWDADNFAEPMDGVASDLTFAPVFSSTCNFTEAARLASTPFGGIGEAATLGDPAVSSIKPEGAETFQMDTDPSHSEENSTTGQQGMARRSNRYSSHPGDPGPLSPIIERSDEDVKSGGSSLGSTNHGCTTLGSTVFSGHSTMKTPGLMKIGGGGPTEEHLLPIVEASRSCNDDLKTSKAEEQMANQTWHEIDTTNYVPPEPDEKTEFLLNMSVAIDPSDPFDDDLIARFLKKLPNKLEDYPNYRKCEGKMPMISQSHTVQLGDEEYHVTKKLGQGNYARIFSVGLVNSMETDNSAQNQKALKVQKPACPWEFYITSELHKRLQLLSPSACDVRPACMMYVDAGYFFSDGSCLVNTLHSHGTLLDLINTFVAAKKLIPEFFAMYLTVELLRMVQQMHKCRIIHGDIKPDNFLLIGLPQGSDVEDEMTLKDCLHVQPNCLKLIDFGSGIDMKMFPKGTTFTSKVKTANFTCIEMKTNRPWTYQTDLFCLLGTIHVLVFQKYMNCSSKNGTFSMHNVFKRTWKSRDLWSRLFHDLLNIPSCDELPDLSVYIAAFEDILGKQRMCSVSTTVDWLRDSLFSE